MMAGLMVSILWLLALVAAGVFVRDCRRTLANGGVLVAVFLVVFAAASWFTPQPNWVGVLIGLMAFWRLIQGPLPKAGIVLGGASAGLAAALQVSGGVSLWLAGLITAGALLAAFMLHAPAHRPKKPMEWAIIIVAIAAPIVGLVGDFIFGWQSSVMLGRGAQDAAVQAPPLWVIIIIGIALMAGLVRGKWVKQ